MICVLPYVLLILIKLNVCIAIWSFCIVVVATWHVYCYMVFYVFVGLIIIPRPREKFVQ